MRPAAKVAEQLALTEKQKILHVKYEGFIKEQFDQGIVDPLNVFLYLFKKYCDEGYNIAFLYRTRKHIDLLKDVKIENMQQLLAHLDGYWNRTKIESNTDFYMLCFIFFYYFGLPPLENRNLQTIAKNVQTYIDYEIEDFIERTSLDDLPTYYSSAAIGHLFQLNIPDELLKRLLTIFHNLLKKESDHKVINNIFEKLIKSLLNKTKIENILQQIHNEDINCNCPLKVQKQLLDQKKVGTPAERLTKVISEITHLLLPNSFKIILDDLKLIVNVANRSVSEIVSIKNILYSNTKLITEYLLETKDLYNLFFKTLSFDYFTENFNLLAIISHFDEQLTRHFINLVIKELDSEDEERLVICLDVLCYSSIPEDLQKPIIDKLFDLCENRFKHSKIKKSLFKIFLCVNFNYQSQKVIIDKLIEYVNNRHHDRALLEEALDTLTQIDLSQYPAETLAKSIVTWHFPKKQVREILLKFNLPKNYQYHIMQLLFEDIASHADTIIAIFPRLSAGQQIIWLLKLQSIVLNIPAIAQRRDGVAYRNLYFVIKHEYHRAKSTVIQSLDDINELIVEKEIEKVVTAINGENTKDVIAIIDRPLAKRYPQIVDHAFFHAVAQRDIGLIKLLLERKPNLNYIYDGNTSLCLLAHHPHTGIVIAELLIAHGADVNLMNPLDHAVQWKASSVVRLLLSKCPTIKIGDSFHKACHQGSFEMIQLFIAHGIDLNKPDSDGNSPLMCFVSAFSSVIEANNLSRIHINSLDTLTLLLQKGAWDYQVCEEAVTQGWICTLGRLIEYMPYDPERQQRLNDLLSKCDSTYIAAQLALAGADIRFAKLEVILLCTKLTSRLISIIEENINNKEPWHKSLININFMGMVDYQTIENIILILKILSCGINYRDGMGKTILHHVCESNKIANLEDRIKLGRILLAAGASLFIRDKQDKIPEDYICLNDFGFDRQSGSLVALQNNEDLYEPVDKRIVKDNKSRWKESFARNYEEQLMLKTMLYFAMIRQSTKEACLIQMLPLDIFNIILQFLAPDNPKFNNEKIATKFANVGKSVGTIFQERNTVEMSNIRSAQEISFVRAIESATIYPENMRRR